MTEAPGNPIAPPVIPPKTSARTSNRRWGPALVFRAVPARADGPGAEPRTGSYAARRGADVARQRHARRDGPAADRAERYGPLHGGGVRRRCRPVRFVKARHGDYGV